MGLKYPGVFLLVRSSSPAEAVAQARVSAALVIAAFLASSRSSLPTATRPGTSVFGVSEWPRDGWLGFEHDHIAPIAFVGRLWEGLARRSSSAESGSSSLLPAALARI